MHVVEGFIGSIHMQVGLKAVQVHAVGDGADRHLDAVLTQDAGRCLGRCGDEVNLVEDVDNRPPEPVIKQRQCL